MANLANLANSANSASDSEEDTFFPSSRRTTWPGLRDASPPVLPDRRPRCITPLPSSTRPDSDYGGSSNSQFFNLLPPEIRRHIYLAAFGNRTLHLDFEWRFPFRYGTGHANLYGHAAEDWSGELGWRWWSCVCHRPYGSGKEDDLWRDKCGIGSGWCPGGGSSSRNECFVGVMGWLLTCRRAYVRRARSCPRHGVTLNSFQVHRSNRFALRRQYNIYQ
jgi:hypothetical protein